MPCYLIKFAVFATILAALAFAAGIGACHLICKIRNEGILVFISECKKLSLTGPFNHGEFPFINFSFSIFPYCIPK